MSKGFVRSSGAVLSSLKGLKDEMNPKRVSGSYTIQGFIV